MLDIENLKKIALDWCCKHYKLFSLFPKKYIVFVYGISHPEGCIVFEIYVKEAHVARVCISLPIDDSPQIVLKRSAILI